MRKTNIHQGEPLRKRFGQTMTQVWDEFIEWCVRTHSQLWDVDLTGEMAG
jgi:hypothetical protein